MFLSSSSFPTLQLYCSSFFSWNTLSPFSPLGLLLCPLPGLFFPYSSGGWLLLEQVSSERLPMTTLSKIAPPLTVTLHNGFYFLVLFTIIWNDLVYVFVRLFITHPRESRGPSHLVSNTSVIVVNYFRGKRNILWPMWIRAQASLVVYQ